ncbi:transposase [Polaribacter sp. ALD11]|uniref:transposase n=1 Tax=Polaribacter sp. ALD11 TaxID=2058137 RepID=UPI0034A3D776
MLISINKNKANNLRNGCTKKKLNTTLGKTDIQVPRDRNSSFNPMIIKKGQNTAEEIKM